MVRLPSSVPPYPVALGEVHILSLACTHELLPPVLAALHRVLPVGDCEDPRMQCSRPSGPLLAIGF